MNRFHVHLHVDDLARSIGFYSKLFAAEPTRVEADYAKWMIEDPRINFAISTRGNTPGIDHLGFQTDSAEQLAALKARAEDAAIALIDDGETTCCYARSEKHWITDPQGIAWEQFHTLGNIPVFHEEAPAAIAAAPACCAPRSGTTVNAAALAAVSTQEATAAAARGKPIDIAVKAAKSCC